jgi:2-keto-4-pentenoate hydratase/2-oxohepta-3-ene-1,7-dioic acid hydratase in catechol pathway
VDDVHYEGEIGVMIGSTGRYISTENAWSVISGIMAVNDVTARKIQRDENQWFKGKGFDTFCPVGEVISVTEEDFKGLTLLTRVNGEERQRGSVSEMIFSLPFLIAYISKVVTLEKGDIVVTGTPAGVGSLFPGDRVEVEIEGKTVLLNQVIKESLHHD